MAGLKNKKVACEWWRKQMEQEQKKRKWQNINRSAKKVVDADVVRWHRIYIFIQKRCVRTIAILGGHPPIHIQSRKHHRRSSVLCCVYVYIWAP